MALYMHVCLKLYVFLFWWKNALTELDEHELMLVLLNRPGNEYQQL